MPQEKPFVRAILQRVASGELSVDDAHVALQNRNTGFRTAVAEGLTIGDGLVFLDDSELMLKLLEKFTKCLDVKISLYNWKDWQEWEGADQRTTGLCEPRPWFESHLIVESKSSGRRRFKASGRAPAHFLGLTRDWGARSLCPHDSHDGVMAAMGSREQLGIRGVFSTTVYDLFCVCSTTLLGCCPETPYPDNDLQGWDVTGDDEDDEDESDEE